MLIGKPKNKVESIIGSGRKDFFSHFCKFQKTSEKIKFKVIKLKKYQEKFRKKAKVGFQNKYHIQVKICQEYISEKLENQLLEANNLG